MKITNIFGIDYVSWVSPKEPVDEALIADVGKDVGFLVRAPNGTETFITDEMVDYLYAAKNAADRK
jgi:hypothetical protein